MNAKAQESHVFARGAADWLPFAAAPGFALMALMTGIFGNASPDILCSVAHNASPLGGMVPMYVLMSAFHSAPWLKLILGRGGEMPRRAQRTRG